MLLVPVDSPDTFDPGESLFRYGEGGLDVPFAGLVNHLFIHIDVIEEVVFAPLAVDGVVNDVYGDRLS